MSQHAHPALRLTPAHSPFFRNTPPRSPTKAYRSEELGLQLKKIIGTTTSSANGFDSLPAARSFAFTAGAAAVLATVGENLEVSQRFFRARPTPNGGLRDANTWPASPTPGEPRHRVLGSLREHSVSGSPLASSGRDWSDSPTGRSSTAKDRVKTVSSVAISPNGKWLALGETGYKPRIAIFSLADESCDAPITTISEHSFGVHALKFSPDSRYLASLGTVNDGFLYIWTIDDKIGSVSLHASNKLTILTNAMTWAGKNLITAGLRFVKVWRIEDDNTELQRSDSASSNFLTPRTRGDLRSSDFGNSILSPKHRTLAGKNGVLGDLLECNFVSAVPLSDAQSIICADTGEICLLDDKQKTLTLNLVKIVTFAIGAARIDKSGLLAVLGPEGQSQTLDASEYLHPSRPPSRTRTQPVSPTKASARSNNIIATSCLGDDVVELSSERVITLRAGSRSDLGSSVELPAHREAIQGVRPFRVDGFPTTTFMTFSSTGTVHMWDDMGCLVKSMAIPVPSPVNLQSASNELRCISGSRNGGWLASGDKCGILTIVEVATDGIAAQVRAHSAEITDLAVFCINDFDFVATAGRDRMVQLFAWTGGQLSLLQTMDEHAGAVTGVLFEPGGGRLLTHSADRSAVVREALLRDPNDASSLVFAMLRTITLKAAPTSICLAGEDEILISTVDRYVGRYRLKNGQCNLNFKCSDLDGGEAVVMSKVLYAPSLNGNPTIAGVTSTDKSVRLYSDYGSLIARDWGHTEGITDIAILSTDAVADGASVEPPRLVTVAADSTIFIWDTTSNVALTNIEVLAPDGSNGLLGVADDVAMAPPLRKVISQTELSRFRRRTSADESEPSSPTATLTASPQRLRKKTSRVSIAQPPRLEPALRSSTTKSSRRESLRHRSPSPPSPRNNTASKRDLNIQMRRRSMATLRSKSTDNVLKEMTPPPEETTASNNSGLTASTESLCRTLRSYRKRLAVSNASETLTTEATRELEKELRLTALVVGERQQGKTLDETVMVKLLDSASDKLVGLLDEKIRERVETEVRKSSCRSLDALAEPRATDDHNNGHIREMDAVSPAQDAVSLGAGNST